MNKKYYLLIFFLILSAVSVSAGLIDDVFGSIDLNIAEGYENYHVSIDFVLYLLLFISIAQVGLAKFSQQSKMLPSVMGIILAVAMASAGYMWDFKLGDLKGYAFLLLITLFIVLIINIFKHLGVSGGKLGTGITMLVVYGLINVNEGFSEWLSAIPKVGGIIDGVMGIALAFGVVLTIWGLFGLWPSNKSPITDVSRGLGGAIGAGAGAPASFMDSFKEKRDEGTRVEDQEVNEEKDIRDDLKKIIGDLDEIQKGGDVGKEQKDLQKRINDLQPHINRLAQLGQAEEKIINTLNPELQAKEAEALKDFRDFMNQAYTALREAGSAIDHTQFEEAIRAASGSFINAYNIIIKLIELNKAEKQQM